MMMMIVMSFGTMGLGNAAANLFGRRGAPKLDVDEYLDTFETFAAAVVDGRFC